MKIFKIKIGYDSEPLDIRCNYCNSVYDFREHKSCPNCGAVPDKGQVNAAKAEIRAARLAENTAVPPVPQTGKFIRRLIKLIPVWVVFIFTFIWIPDIKINSDEKKIVQNLQIIEAPQYKDEQIGVPFTYDNFFEVTVEEFKIADSDAVRALLPEGYRLLTVHLTAASDGTGAVNDYYEV